MRRLLLISLVIALAIGVFAGVASARFAQGSVADDRAVAPFDAPQLAPHADPVQERAYGYRSSVALGAQMTDAANAAGGRSTRGGSSASVTVTAVVLPVVYLVVDPATSEVVEVFTNTDERDPRGVLYLVRSGSVEGAPRALTTQVWQSARPALAATHAGTGSIWSA